MLAPRGGGVLGAEVGGGVLDGDVVGIQAFPVAIKGIELRLGQSIGGPSESEGWGVSLPPTSDVARLQV